MIFITFDEVSNVAIPADKRSINGAFDSQLLLQGLGVTLQVSVWSSSFIDMYFIRLMEQDIKKLEVIITS